MKGTLIYFYIFVMWILIIVGGGILVSIIAPISIHGFGVLDPLIDSVVKAAIALVLVILWILVMSKIKNWVFHKQLNH